VNAGDDVRRKPTKTKQKALAETARQGKAVHIRLLIIVATLLLGASSQTFGAINGWTAIGPNGGRVNKIVFNKSTPNTVYAIAAGGFYRSLDGGKSWQLIKSDFQNAPEDLAIDPSDPTRVYVVAPNYPSLYMSTDGGASMSAVMTLPTAVTSAWQVAVSQSGTTLYVTSGAQVFYSTDRANTWTKRTAVSIYSSAQVWKLAIDPTDSNTLYAHATMSATAEGTFVTHDGAMTWQLLTSGGVSQDFAINAANSTQIWSARFDGVWFSNDKGVTWTKVLANGSSSIAIDPSNPSILYAGTPYGSVFRTADAGATWVDVTGNNTAGQLTTIAIDPAQSAHLLVGGLNGLVGTTTSGTQWSAQTAGINSTTILGLSADPAADRIYINVSSGGVYYSAAGAAATMPANNLGSGGLLQLSQAPTLNVTAILAQPGRLSASLANGLARSADGGATWSLVQVTPSGTSDQVFSFASWPGNPQDIVAATSTTLFRTTDGGDLWTPAVTGLPANAIAGSLVAAASDPTIVYASIYTMTIPGPGPDTFFGVYKSTDAGLSWAPANTGIASSGISALAVDPTNAKVVYAATESALLKSVDGGATWSPMAWDASATGGYPDSIAIDPKHPSILYAARWFVARSADGGMTWQTLRAASALPTWSSFVMLADPNRPENILVSTLGSGVQQFTVAPDLSLTVAAPPSPVAVGAAAAYNYTVKNLGPFDATGVTVSVQLPVAAQGISAAASGGNCTIAASVATCVFGVVATGSSYAITLNATAPAVGPFQLAAAVVGDQPDSNPSNNTVTTTESIANLADLSVTVAGTATAQVGGAVSYSVVVANAGPNVAAASQLTFQLAPGLTPGTATFAGTACTANASQLFTCAIGDLAAAKSVTVTINATAAIAGTGVSTATVSSAATDLVASNNSATGSTAVTAVPPPAAAPSKGGGGSLTFSYLLMLTIILIIQWRTPRTRRP
jgi:uncharacterized repeat protein (TIGR01451 family)